MLVPVVAVSLASPACAADAGKPDAIQVGMPDGFGDLARSQQSVVDIIFGGQRIGQAEVRYEPGKVRFTHVDAVVAMLPDITDPEALKAALGGDLDPHADMVCTDAAPKRSCGSLAPATAEVIFDLDHFRLEIFLNARLLKVRAVTDQAYLPRPDAPLSLVDSVAGSLAGGSGGGRLFAIQNRAVIGSRDARLVSTTSYASGNGLVADVLAAQIDKPGIRYTGGMFWAPGIDLVGRRKMIGAGVETQLDTRFDKDVLQGTPLIVSLTQRSRVDLLVDGRLVSSRTYEAGNQSLDTSSLSDGAYEVVIHIQQVDGASRDERRFFTKNARIAPMGRPLWFVHAGVLADERTGAFISPTRQTYIEAGIARRFTPHLAMDATVVGVDGKAIVQLGGYLIYPVAQVRFGVMGSSQNDRGALLQVNSSGTSRLNYYLDVRRLHSHDDQPIIPIGDLERSRTGSILGNFQNAQIAAGTFVQGLADISYRFAQAQIGVSAFYRQDKGRAVTYAVGPTARWSVLHRGGLDITVEANASQANSGRVAYAGVRLQLLRPRSSLGSTAGVQALSSQREGKRESFVGGIQGTLQREDVLGGSLVVSGNVDHTPDNDLARARADLRSGFGNVAADVVQQIGDRGATQYSLGFQTAVVVNRRAFAIAGREQSDSMIAVHVKDAPPKAQFQVLVNETPRGTISGRETLPIAVTPYRQYRVRIRPIGGDLVHFDSAGRDVSVYPGNVASLSWAVRQVVAMFGRVVRSDGTPVADADILSEDAIGHTDLNGYFQIEASPKARMTVRTADGQSCTLLLNDVEQRNGYAALGTVRCQEPFSPVRSGTIAVN